MPTPLEQKSIDLNERFGTLQVTLSGIEVQKKNTTRFSLFVKDDFLMGVSDSAFVHFNLKKGMELDQQKVNAILEFEQRWAIREYLIRLLARRDHSKTELLKKGLKKGYLKGSLEEILDELSEKGYINNQGFARKFARDKFRFNHWGAQKIRVELIKKGISPTDIQLALEELESDDQIEKMFYLVQKSTARFRRKQPEKRRKNVFDFLMRKGYDSEVILKHMDKLLEQLNE